MLLRQYIHDATTAIVLTSIVKCLSELLFTRDMLLNMCAGLTCNTKALFFEVSVIIFGMIRVDDIRGTCFHERTIAEREQIIHFYLPRVFDNRSRKFLVKKLERRYEWSLCSSVPRRSATRRNNYVSNHHSRLSHQGC